MPHVNRHSFRVQGSTFRVQGLVFGVSGLGFSGLNKVTRIKEPYYLLYAHVMVI